VFPWLAEDNNFSVIGKSNIGVRVRVVQPIGQYFPSSKITFLDEQVVVKEN
jgi:hypothetical protein